MRIRSCAVVALCMALPAAAFANSPSLRKPSMMHGQLHHQCVDGMQQNVSAGISFSIKAKSFAEAKAKFDAKINEISSFAKQQNLKHFELQSMNYNISAQQVDFEDGQTAQGYMLNGNANYMLDSADSAFKFGQFLEQKKIKVNINVNSYKNPQCSTDNNDNSQPEATE